MPVSKERNSRNKNKPYVTRSGLEAIKSKHTKWLKYKYCKTAENHVKYKKARKLATSELRTGKYLSEKDLAARIKTENKLFWGYVWANNKTKSAVNKHLDDEGKVSENNQETADILNIFASVFEIEDDEELPVFEKRAYNRPLETVDITEELVSKAIDRTKASKSQGPDGIHPTLLKETKKVIQKPLKILFEKSMNESKIPTIWKKKSKCDSDI